MDLAQIILGVLATAAAALAAWYGWLALAKHEHWRREDRRERLIALLKASYNEILHAMNDAQRQRTMGSLGSVEALMADVGYSDLSPECRQAIGVAHEVCRQYLAIMPMAWARMSAQGETDLVRLWRDGCRALEVVRDEAFEPTARERVSLPRLLADQLTLLKRNSADSEGRIPVELQELERELRAMGCIEE